MAVLSAAGIYLLAMIPLPPDEFATLMALLFIDLIVGALILVYVVHQKGLERQRLEQIQESEERYRTFIEQTTEGIFFTDEQGRLVEWNRVMEEITGLMRAEVLGRPAWEIQRLLMPQAHIPAGSDAELHELYMDGLQRGSASWMNRVIDTVYLHVDGTQHSVEVRLFPINTARGQGLGNLARDITQRKRAEQALLQLNQELEQRVRQRTAELEAKNRELETFSYSVSHDLKAPLRGIEGYSRLLQEDYAARLGEEGGMFLQQIRSGVARMNMLIRDLLQYTRMEQQEIACVATDLPEAIEQTLAEYADEIQAYQIDVVLKVACTSIQADAKGLSLILRNLIDNAVKFSRGGKAPRIEIGAEPADSTCRLWVRDNGVGFNMQYADRIFEIFQRLQRDEDYPGTGVGLALVRKAAERMGGRVWAEGFPGRGAIFYVEIPQPGTGAAPSPGVK
jgi:hypothetical protein